MTRSQVTAEARKLRKREGLSYAQLEARLRVPRSTLHEWLEPKIRQRYRDSRRVSCPECGDLMAKSSALCIGCRRDAADRRARQVEQLWASGASMQKIAKSLGITKGTLGSLMDDWRAMGYTLPYRRRWAKGHKYPEQAAA